jgi:hypothetical protein
MSDNTYPLPSTGPETHAAPATSKTSGLAVAALVLGIVWVYWLGSILAVIFGAVAIKQINRSNGWRTGKGMAVAGLVLGLVGIGMLVLVLLVALGANSGADGSGY